MEKTLRETGDRLRKTQERYKKNYDQRLRKQSEIIKEDDFVYLRVERRDENETRHKLAAVAEGPYKVLEATRRTVVIERPDHSVEKVSRDRVTLAPRPRTVDEVRETIRPMTDQELEHNDYPVGEDTNRYDLSRELTNEDEQPRKSGNNQPNGRDTADSTSIEEPEQHPILGTTNSNSEQTDMDPTGNPVVPTRDTKRVDTETENGMKPGKSEENSNESQDSDVQVDHDLLGTTRNQ